MRCNNFRAVLAMCQFFTAPFWGYLGVRSRRKTLLAIECLLISGLTASIGFAPNYSILLLCCSIVSNDEDICLQCRLGLPMGASFLSSRLQWQIFILHPTGDECTFATFCMTFPDVWITQRRYICWCGVWIHIPDKCS